MISEFKVQDFKCYEDANYFKFSGLTILCGTNNSGKSSLLQSIYLSTQVDTAEIPALLLNNDNFRLGAFSDVLYKDKTNEDPMEFAIVFDLSLLHKDLLERLRINIVFKNPATLQNISLQEGDPVLRSLEVEFQKPGDTLRTLCFKLLDITGNDLYKIEGDLETGYTTLNGLVPSTIIYADIERKDRRIASSDYELICSYLRLISTRNIHYLKALRVDNHLQSKASEKRILGISGENTSDIIGNNWNLNTSYHDRKNKPIKFSIKFQEWITQLLGEQFLLKPKKEINGYRIFIEEKSRGLELELGQVGFGISQLLPILTMLLTSKEHDVILIENPEIHLHPKLQAELVELFVFALEANRKLIIETHSEHIINRIRLRIKENSQLKEKINIYFFEKDDICKYQEIEVDDNGNIEYWPKDFFDQAYYDLSGLIRR